MIDYVKRLSSITSCALLYTNITVAREFSEINRSVFPPIGNLHKQLVYKLGDSDSDGQSQSSGLNLGSQKKDKDNNQIISILAMEIDNVDNTLIASGMATLFSKEIYAISDSLQYDHKKKQVKMMGNVRIYRKDGLYLQTEQAHIYMNSNYNIIKPMYVQDGKTGIWMNAESAATKDNIFRFDSSIMSGCPVDNAAWWVASSSGYYNRDRAMMTLWNARIYVGDIPIFYMPYLKFSTQNRRTTGILYPTVGTSVTDGFIYIQPYFIAPQDRWDMTVSPQVRTNRGTGINYEFRIVDNDGDRYTFHSKFFNNLDHYTNELSLLNKNVYGFDFNTRKRNFLEKIFGVKTGFDNAILFDFFHTNDLDYLRLDTLGHSLSTSSYVSKANAYAQMQNDYFGVNFKYFLNLSKGNNLSTFQNLPNFQYHRYLNSTLFNELLYSIDYQFKNTYRAAGYRYVSHEAHIPMGMQFSVFQKYTSLALWANIRAGNVYAHNNTQTVIFTGQNQPQLMKEKVGNYIAMSYRVSISTDIGREYKNFFHSVQGNISIIAPFSRGVFTNGILSENIMEAHSMTDVSYMKGIQEGEDIWDPTSFSSIFLSKNTVNMHMANYFYGRGGKELFYWRLRQIVNLNDMVSVMKVPMENKISLSPAPGLKVSASTFYSWYYNAMTELGVILGYGNRFVHASLSYFLKRDDAKFSFDPTTLTFKAVNASNYLNTSVHTNLGYFGVNAGLNYDLKSQTLLNFNVGIYKDIKCFGIGFKFGSDRKPILTQSDNENGSISIIHNSYVKFEMKFVPLTSVGYTHKLRADLMGSRE